jgi:hypothetical protein
MNQRALEDFHAAALAAHQNHEVFFRVDPPRLRELPPTRGLPVPSVPVTQPLPPPPPPPLVLRGQGGGRG